MLLQMLIQGVTQSIGLPSMIGLVMVDVTLEETHNFKAIPTDFPVEGGSFITDHVRLEPLSLSISGFVTDTPLTSSGIGLGRAKTVSTFYLLEQMWRDRVPFTVLSQLRIYSNMIVESVSIPKSRESALRFNATLREIQFAYGQNAFIPATSDKSLQNSSVQASGGGISEMTSSNVANVARDSVGVDAGRQVTEVTSGAAAENASILHQVFYGG